MTFAVFLCVPFLVADPSEAVGSAPGIDAAHNFERMQIDYDDVSLGRAGHVDARPVGLHKNSDTISLRCACIWRRPSTPRSSKGTQPSRRRLQPRSSCSPISVPL